MGFFNPLLFAQSGQLQSLMNGARDIATRPGDFHYFWVGMVIGLAIAVPVGPIGVLCIKRSLGYGRLSGLFSGLGAATADSAYGAVAAFGLTTISSFLVGHHRLLQTIGVLFLLFFGIRILMEKPQKAVAMNVNDGSLLQDYISTFLLTLTNPMTILSFIAIFAGVGLADNTDVSFSVNVVLGVFLGSLIWWTILSMVVGSFRRVVNENLFRWVNKISGVIILAFAILIILLEVRRNG